MASRPSYLTHHVEEKDVTVDWFFGHGHLGRRILQLVLIVIGWIAAILPVVITASAVINRNDPLHGWWKYGEGFQMWDWTMLVLGFLTVVFMIGFLAAHLAERASLTHRNQIRTYDEQRLEQRLRIAGDWYAGKFGPELLRLQEKRVRIEPYGDLETYELRDAYRAQGVE